MGNQSSATKPKSSLFSKRTKNGGVSPLMLPTSIKKDISPQTKSTGGRRRGTLETQSNIANNSTFSFKTKASTTDQLSEDTSRIAHTMPTIDASSNSPSTLEDLDLKKPFQYKKGPLIGKGFYGDVFECLNLSSGELLAVKSIKVEGDISRFQNYIEALKREILVLKALSHPNVIKYYAVDLYEAKNESYSMIDIISEYVSGGSIKVLVGKFDKLDERVISSYTKQILEGLAYLHSKDILHRNMKSSNVLIDACGTAKLTDFGCFKSLEKFVETNNQEYRKSPPSTKSAVYWTAPEVLMKKSQGKPADIWGVGCVVIEMLTNSPPWGSLNLSLDLVSKQIMSGAMPPLPSTISEECQDFLNQVFRFRPEDRPTACELLDHPFIRDSLPSLTCIDMEGSQTLHLSQTGIKSIENLQEEARSRPSTTSSKPRSQNNLFFPEEPKQQLSIHVGGENKIIPNRSRKRSSTSGLNQSIKQNEIENSAEITPTSDSIVPKLTIKRVSSQETLRDDGILTPGKTSDRLNTGPKEHKIVQSPTFKTISKAISPQEASKYNFNYTPIRNSFFNERSRKASIPINSQPESSRERHTETTGSTTNQEENAYLNTSELRKQQEELAAQPEEPTNLFTEDDEEKRKMELRRKYEEQMQQELIDMNQSNTSEIWGLRAH